MRALSTVSGGLNGQFPQPVGSVGRRPGYSFWVHGTTTAALVARSALPA
jgi:hypothetical protein